MKQCPKCQKKYGNDWGVCINDSTQLIRIEDTSELVAEIIVSQEVGSIVCPYCKETIKKGAIKCKHCGESVDVASTVGKLIDNIGSLFIWLGISALLFALLMSGKYQALIDWMIK